MSRWKTEDLQIGTAWNLGGKKKKRLSKRLRKFPWSIFSHKLDLEGKKKELKVKLAN